MAATRWNPRVRQNNQLNVNSCRTVEARSATGSECSDALFCKNTRARARGSVRRSLQKPSFPLLSSSRRSYLCISNFSSTAHHPPPSSTSSLSSSFSLVSPCFLSLSFYLTVTSSLIKIKKGSLLLHIFNYSGYIK